MQVKPVDAGQALRYREARFMGFDRIMRKNWMENIYNNYIKKKSLQIGGFLISYKSFFSLKIVVLRSTLL